MNDDNEYDHDYERDNDYDYNNDYVSCMRMCKESICVYVSKLYRSISLVYHQFSHLIHQRKSVVMEILS